MNEKLEEELRKWRAGDTVSLEDQLELEPDLRRSANNPNERYSLLSVDSSSPFEKNSTDYHVAETVKNEMMTNGADNKAHEKHVNQLNSKIARLEEELESWRSGEEVPPEEPGSL